VELRSVAIMAWNRRVARYPAEFQRKVLDLVEDGRPVPWVAHGLKMSVQCIYARGKQQLIDRGPVPATTSTDRAELVAPQKRIAEVKNELAIRCRATALLDDVVPQNAEPGHRVKATSRLALGLGGGQHRSSQEFSTAPRCHTR
jgi:transposase-like protein